MKARSMTRTNAHNAQNTGLLMAARPHERNQLGVIDGHGWIADRLFAQPPTPPPGDAAWLASVPL